MSEPTRPFYEPFIARHFPQWHAKREQARATAQQYGLMSSYRGSMTTRTDKVSPTSSSYTAGTASQRQALRNMRDRARRVYEDNYIGRCLLDTEVDNIVADGCNLQVKSSSPEFNSEAEDKFGQWLESAEVRNLLCASDFQRQAYRSPRRDGDGGIVLIDKSGKLLLQYIPGDRIQTPYGASNVARAGSIVDGVEIDGASRPIAFHLLDEWETGKRNWSRVSAYQLRDNEPVGNFIYLAPVLQDLQVRGETCYAQVFPLLDQVDGYVDAVVIAARMACVFGLIFKEESAQKQTALLGTAANADGKQQKAVTLENGQIRYMGRDGEAVQVQAQQPMNQTPDFIRAMCRLIGMPFDMPLELVAKDMSQVNFASARIGLLGYYRACRARQRRFIERCMVPIYRWWSYWMMRRGLFTTRVPGDYWRHKFITRGWDYTDPVSEAQGDLLQIDMGIKTPQMVAAERGRDYEEMEEDIERAYLRRVEKRLGIVQSTMTRQSIVIGAAPPAKDDGNAAPATPLNGAQITAAIDVLTKYREGALSDSAATELLVQIGIASDKAATVISSLSKLTAGTGDVAFKREVLKSLLTVPAAREAIYEGVDMEDLVMQTGLSPEANYEFPHIPLKAAPGELVSGEVVTDKDGDVVGGDVLPAPSPADDAGASGKGQQGENANGQPSQPAPAE